jgi:hypothetical protein
MFIAPLNLPELQINHERRLMMNHGNLSLAHDIIGKLYLVSFQIKEDETISKEYTLASIQEIIKQMATLTELLHQEQPEKLGE